MNTEHTNQSSQAAPVPHSHIDLQSIPDRQRSFTAENIRDIAHDCIRIGDNDQAEVVFAIADALRDGNLIIKQQAEPVAWGCFHFGGKRDGKLYSFSDTKEQADAYIANIHQSRDDITLRSGPIYAQPPAVAVPDDAAILTHFHAEKDQDTHLYSDPGEVVYQLTQAELLQAARAMLAAAPQAAGLNVVTIETVWNESLLPAGQIGGA